MLEDPSVPCITILNVVLEKEKDRESQPSWGAGWSRRYPHNPQVREEKLMMVEKVRRGMWVDAKDI